MKKNSAKNASVAPMIAIDTPLLPLIVLLLFFAGRFMAPLSHYILKREADEKQQQVYQHTHC